MSKCNYTAPDGSRSKVGEYLENKYGEERTVELWQKLNSIEVLSLHDWKTDQRWNLSTGELKPEVAEWLLSNPSRNEIETVGQDIFSGAVIYSGLPDIVPTVKVEGPKATQEELDAAKAEALADLLAEYEYDMSSAAVRPSKVVDDKVFSENLARMFAEKRDTDGKVTGYFTDTEQKAAVDSILTDIYSSVRTSLANGENLTVGTLLNALKNTRIRITGYSKALTDPVRKGAVLEVVNSFDQLAGFALERLRAYGFNISDKVISRISEYLKSTTPKSDLNEIQETNDNNKNLITDEDTQETITGNESRGIRDWNDVTFELDPRDTASKRLKFFLATIIDSELGVESEPRRVNLLFNDTQMRADILSGTKRYTTRSAEEAKNIKFGPDGRGSFTINNEVFEVKVERVIEDDTDRAKYGVLFEQERAQPVNGSVVYSIDKFVPKNNIPKNKLSYLGFPTLANFESLFEDILGVLGDTDRSWENFRAILMSSKRPNLMRVAMELDNSDEQLRNEFIKVMSKQYQPFTMVLFNLRTLPDGTKSMQARPINANRSSAAAVILNQWKENQKESAIIVKDDIGRLGVNTELADKWQRQLDGLNTIGLSKLNPSNTAKAYNFAREILTANGINLTDPMFTDLMSNMARLTGKQSFAGDWLSQFRVTKDGKPLGIFSTIIMKLSGRSTEISEETGIDVDADSFLKNNNPLYTENSVMKVLTGVALRYTEKLYSSSHKSSQGKSIYDWGLNTYQSHEIRKLKTDKNYLKQMQTVTFAKDSWLLKNIINDPEAKSRLQLGYLDGLRSRYKNADGITRSEMSDREQNLTALAMFQNTGYKYASFIDMTKSDKTTTPVLMNVLKLPLKDGFANQKTIQDAMNDVFKSEFNRIREWSVNKANFNNAQYQKGGGLFYMLTHFNYSEMVKAQKLGIITKEQLDSVWNSDGTISTSDDVVTRAGAVRALNVKFVKDLRANTVADWRRDGIFSDKEHLFDESWVKKANRTLNIKFTKTADGTKAPFVFERDAEKRLRPRQLSMKEYNTVLGNFAALEYSTNYFLFNTSMAQLVSGDPALVYKPVRGGNDMANVIGTLKEYQKRLAKDIGPGSDPTWDINEKYATITLADFDYKSYLSNFGLTAYTEFDTSTDAQEITTTKEHLYVMYSEGKVPVNVYREMVDIIEEGIKSPDKYYEFTKKEHLDIVMQPHKPVYVGAEIRDGVKQLHYIKSSSYPLLPQFTRGLQIDGLRQRMEGDATGKGYIARAHFKSAKKIGSPVAPVNIFNSKGDLDTTALNSAEFENSIIHLTREGFRIQQEVPYDEEKEAIRTVSQMNKLIFEGTLSMSGFDYRGGTYTGKELRSIKEDIRNKMLDIGKQDFLRKVGAEQTEEGNYTFRNLEKFYKALEEEAISRKYPTNDIEALRLRGKSEGRTQLVLPLWFNGSADRFESLAMALVRKIVEVKMPGKSFVQASSSGFKSIQTYDQLSKEQRSQIVWAPDYDTTQGLRSLDKTEDGSTKPAQVLVPWNFFGEQGKLPITDYIGADGRIDNDKLPVELRQFIGARIPNQGHNSMLPIEIVGFIPDNMGDLMIVPPEITQQMGSDFDVDKLYVYKRAYKQNGGKLEVYNNTDEARQSDSEMKNLKNQYFDIHWSVLTNPIMFDKILKPLDKPDLKNEKAFAESIDAKSGFQNYFDIQSQLADFQSQKDAKRLVGSSSLSTTFNALIQDKSLRLGYIDFSADGGPKEVPITIDFKDELTGETISLHRISGEGIAKYYENDNPTDKDVPLERTKHDNITSQQSEFLDHAKNRTIDFLNINNYTYPTSAAMSMLESDEGVALSLKYNSRLLQQEIIKEYAREMAMGGDSLSTGSTGNLKERVMLKLRKKYGSLAGVKLGDSVGSNVFSPQELSEMLVSPTKDSAYYAKQLAVLDVFSRLDQVGTKLVDIQGTLNQDTAGAGANLLYSLQQTQRLQNLLSDDLIQGVNDIAGDFIADEVFIPTTEIGHTYNNTVTVANGLLTEILPYDRLTGVFDEVKAFSGTPTLSVDRQREIFKEMKSFMFSANSLELARDTTAERARLLYDTSAGDSLAKRVQKAKSTWAKDNYLMQRLQTNIAEKIGDESTVQYNASKASNLDDYENIKAWISMLRSSDEEVKRLAEDLVSYVYLTGGVQNAVSFVKFVPISYLNATPFAERLRILSNQIDLENPVKRYSFIRQYYQHNPNRAIGLAEDMSQAGPAYTKALEDTKVAPERFILPVIGVEENTASDLIIRNPDRAPEAVADIYPPFLSLRFGSETYLYERDAKIASDVATSYTRIDTLGKGQISEYSYDTVQPRSIFVENRAVIKAPNYEQEIRVQTGRPELAKPENELPELYEKLGFTEGVTYSHIANQLENNPEVTNVHRSVLKITTPIIDRASDLFKDLDETTIGFMPESSWTPKDGSIEHGTYDGSNTRIGINPMYNDSFEKLGTTMAHESIHAVTAHAIQFAMMNGTKTLPKVVADSYNRLQELYTLARSLNTDQSYNTTYALSSIHEFVAHAFEDKDFQTLLNGMVDPNAPTKSIIEHIADAVTQLFEAIAEFIGIQVKQNSVLNSVIRESLGIMGYESTNTYDTASMPSKYELFPGKFANEEQREAIDKMGTFVTTNVGSNYFVLSGAGGTGKTTIIKKLVEDLVNQGYNPSSIAYSGLTHTAVQQLRRSVNDRSFQFSTIHSLLGVKKDERASMEQGKEVFKASGLSRIDDLSVIIIDESSMLSDELMTILQSELSPNQKVIFMGDYAQLEPVGQDEDAFPFRDLLNTPETSAVLIKNERTSHSDILNLLTKYRQAVDKIRDGKPAAVSNINPYENRINSSNITYDSGKDFLTSYMEKIREAVANRDPYNTILVAYRNDRRNQINNVVRTRLFGADPAKFMIGDLLIVNSSYSLNTMEKRELGQNSIFNMQRVIVESAIPSIVETVIEIEDRGQIIKVPVKVDGWNLVVNLGPDYNGKTVRANSANDGEIAKIIGMTYDKTNKATPVTLNTGQKLSYGAYIKFKDAILGAFLDTDYAYAVTSHKSQGMTYPYVFVEESDILSVGPASNKNKIKSLYTALSRTKEHLWIFNGSNPRQVSQEALVSAKGSAIERMYQSFFPGEAIPITIKSAAEFDSLKIRIEEAFPTIQVNMVAGTGSNTGRALFDFKEILSKRTSTSTTIENTEVNKAVIELESLVATLSEKLIKTGKPMTVEETGRYEALRQEIGRLQNNINTLRVSENLATMDKAADQQLKWVERMVSKPDVTLNEIFTGLVTTNTWSNVFNEVYGINFQGELPKSVSLLKGASDLLSKKIMGIAQRYFVEHGSVIDSFDDYEVENLQATSVSAQVRDLSRAKSRVGQEAAKLLQEAYQFKREEIARMRLKFNAYNDKLQNLAKDRGMKVSQIYDKFFQKNIADNAWGLVQLYSQDYYDFRKSTRDRLRATLNLAESAPTAAQRRQIIKNAWDKYQGAVNQNLVFVNTTVFFDKATGARLSGAKVDNARDILVRNVGAEEAETLINKAEREYLKYLDDRSSYRAELQLKAKEDLANYIKEIQADKSFTQAEKDILIKDFKERTTDEFNADLNVYDNQRSPFSFFNRGNGSNQRFTNYEAIVDAPKRTVMGGVFYDNQYAAIQNDPELLEIYNFIQESMNEFTSYLPEHVTKELGPNFLPIIEKTAGVDFTSLTAFKNSMNEGIRDTFTLSQDYADYTNSPSGKIPIRYIQGSRIDIDDREKNIMVLLEKFGTMAYHYKYFSQVQSAVEVLQQIVSDNIHNTEKGVTKISNGVKNLSDMVRTAKEVLMYQQPKKAEVNLGRLYSTNPIEQVRISRRVATLERMKEDLDNKYATEDMDIEEYNAQRIDIDTELASYQSTNVYASKIGDAAIKLTELKALSYNPFSAVANLSFGLVSVLVHANGRRDFTKSEAFQGFSIMLNATKRAITLGSVDSQVAEKILKLMDRFDIMGDLLDSDYGEFTRVRATKDKWKQFISPYQMLRQSDYFVKALTMVSMMLHKKVTHPESGTEISLWDAVDNEGNWKFGDNPQWTSQDVTEQTDFRKFQNQIIAVTKIIMGNQDGGSPMMIKRSVVGRLVAQFRASWMAEGAYSRFEDQRWDDKLGREVKGRYRTYADLGLFGSLLTLGRQALSTLVSIDPYTGKKRDGSELSEIDIDNMRRNLAEVAFFLGVAAAVLMLKAAGGDEEDPKKKRLMTMLINTLIRNRQDIAMYASPDMVGDLTRNIVPAQKVWVDFEKAMAGTYRIIANIDNPDDNFTIEQWALRMTKAGIPHPYFGLINKIKFMAEKDLDTFTQ